MRKSWVPAVGAFLALTLGYIVADLSDIRWLGGLVILVIGAGAIGVLYREGGWLRSIAAIVIVAVAFVISHPLGAVLGSYGSLLVVSAVAGVLVFILTPFNARA